MRQNFDAILAHTLRFEGGYVNDPRDPGGETNMGISRRSYPHEDIRGMTRARAAEIYRRDFWAPIRGDDLPSGLDAVAFDAAVNSGVSRGAKWLQGALGVAADGRIGPATLTAARKADPITVINRALDARLAFLRGLKTWATYGRGWQRRVDEMRVFAIHLAQDAPPAPKPPPLMPKPLSPATAAPPSNAIGWGFTILAVVIAAAMILGAK